MSKESIGRFEERLAAVPRKPGIYIHRSASSEILYVGKSSSLRNRLRSYFSSQRGMSPKSKDLVERIADFEYIVTESEQEALLLENNLIKEHQPHYNARLKDDKSYPFIKVDLAEEFPRIYITRQMEDDGARYFGPFASSGSVRKTLDLLKHLFPYRSCTKKITGKDERPCLEYHIKRCVAPCTGYASRDDYIFVIEQVVKFLEGDTGEVIKDIENEIWAAADRLEFERAAILRDRMRAIERVRERQKVVGQGSEDMDALGIARRSNEAWIELFFIRHGAVIGRDHFTMEGVDDKDDAEVISAFISQFYHKTFQIPKIILSPFTIDDRQVLEDWLTEKRKTKVSIITPQKGAKKRLADMVAENASQGLLQLTLKRLTNKSAAVEAVAALQEELSLSKLPERIECYDISHIQGTHIVASMVVFHGGRPRSAEYRRFKIKAKQSNDDFASMYEVIYRRFLRLKNDEASENNDRQELSSFNHKPDFVLVDGGRGQLNSALEALLQLGFTDISLAALAKREEEIYIPDCPTPIRLPRESHALMLLQRVRDEAHRFAVTFHRSSRSKSAMKSVFDDVVGIGPKRKKILLKKFGSVKGVRLAKTEDIASTPGMTLSLAKRLKAQL